MAAKYHNSVPSGFREIPGCDGRYFVNQQGQVWSACTNQILSQHLDSAKKYLQSLLMMSGRKTGLPRYIHKLVAHAWLGDPPGPIGSNRGQYCINHKDGNKANNCVKNLEWITVEENTRHAWKTGLNASGESKANSKLTAKQVREIRILFLMGSRVSLLAKEFNIDRTHMGRICQFKKWQFQDLDLKVLLKKESAVRARLRSKCKQEKC
jgi:hypothetical protein